MRDVLVGIDPSFETAGVAIYTPEDKRLVLHGGDIFSCVDFLNKSGILHRAIVILEDPGLNSNIYGTWFQMKTSVELYRTGKVGLHNPQGKRSAPWSDGRDRSVQAVFGGLMKQAKNIGQSVASAWMFNELISRAGVPVARIAPSDRHRADKEILKGNGPKGVHLLSMPTKTTAVQFQALTGYTGRSNEHTRDAATLVFGMTIPRAKMLARTQDSEIPFD